MGAHHQLPPGPHTEAEQLRHQAAPAGMRHQRGGSSLETLEETLGVERGVPGHEGDDILEVTDRRFRPDDPEATFSHPVWRAGSLLAPVGTLRPAKPPGQPPPRLRRAPAA